MRRCSVNCGEIFFFSNRSNRWFERVHLNLIERLWKFVKQKALYSRYHENFTLFKTAIDDCLRDVDSKYKKEISSLMSLKFQILNNTTL